MNEKKGDKRVRGIQYVTNDRGQRVGVLLDLNEWGELWEDIYDSMMAMERNGEPSMPLEDFEAELRAEGLIND